MVIEITITDIGFGGDGIGRYQDQVVFVPFVAIGERVKVKVIKQSRRFLKAELLEILDKSPHRAIPPCPYFFYCGGCHYQHLNYKEQVRLKEEQIRQLLKRIGQISQPPVQPIISSPEFYHYRNRIVVHAENGKIGFRARDGKRLIDVAQCAIASEEVNEKLKTLRQRNFKAGHYSLRENTLPQTGFYQTNCYLLETLRSIVLQSLPQQGECLLEGYCGSGFFTVLAAKRFKKVIAVDTDKRSIRQAPLLRNVKWEKFSLETVLFRENPDTLLLDPPREGLNEATIKLLGHKSVQHCVYVSCNPATFARDVQRMAHFLTLKSVQPLDLFPQTAHVEIVAVLQI